MASARNEAPREVQCKEGVSPPHLWRGVGCWLCLSPNCFSIFELKMASFGAFWELILLQ